MLTDKLREGAQGRIFKILFWIIILSFIFTGVGGYLIPRLNTDPVEVGEYKITANEWNQQYTSQTQQMQRMYGARYADMLEDPQYVSNLRSQILEGMIDNVAFNSAVYDLNVRIGDEQVRELIRTTPAFQKDGKFDNDLYLAVIRNMGMNPEYFGEQMRISAMATSVSDPILRTASYPLPYEISALENLLTQTRTIDLYELNLDALRAGFSADDNEAKAYYDAHHDAFMAPANVKFNYILLTVDELKKGINPTDDELEEYLTLHQDDFKVPEHRGFSHIIVRSDNPDAEKIVKSIDDGFAAGKSFADLAKEYSDDLSTKDIGGDMGEITRASLAPIFADKLFALETIGSHTDKIVDADGTHYLQLNSIVKEHIPQLNEIKDQVKNACIDAKARELFNERVTTLSDMSFENPDSLDVTADALGVKVADSGVVALGATKVPWPLNTSMVQNAAFSEENISSGVNSSVVNIGDDAALVLNVYESHESMLKPFDEVKAEAVNAVINYKANKEADACLNTFAKAVINDSNTEIPAHVVHRSAVTLNRGSADVEPAFGMAVFAIPQEGQNRYIIASNKGNPTLAILKEVGNAATTNENAELNQILRSQLVQANSLELRNALYKGARELTEITYNEDAIKLVNQSVDEAP